MSYVLNQYNKVGHKDVDCGDAQNLVFMKLIPTGTATKKTQPLDSEIFGEGMESFKDECVKVGGGLQKNINYYFHGKIKRMSTKQSFDIKLVRFDEEKGDEQYIKTIDIQPLQEGLNEWYDIEFIFTPAADFDTILFELDRIKIDFTGEVRVPIILYEELSLINNIVTSQIGNEIELLKIGVQSRPGLLMCVNGEEIRVGRTGIYEIRNGVIKVTFFSVCAAAQEKEEVDLSQIEESKCIFDTSKVRTIDTFTLDYMYEREV